VLIFIVLATGYNIVLGYTGLVSLGHVALFAIGAYTSAILTTRWDVPFLVAFVCAALLAAIVGAVIGFSALRIKGHYLTLLTLAFSEAAILMLRNLTGLTGGSEGIVGIARPALFGYQLTDPTALYFFLAACALLGILVARRLDRSRFGRSFKAIRDSEIAADVSGVRIAHTKIAAFVISAAYAGFAGSMYAHTLQFISPEFFSIGLTITLLAMVLLGGRGTVFGPVIGAIALVVLPEKLRFVHEYYLIVFGISIWLTMLFASEGVIGSIDRFVKRAEFRR